MSLMYLAKVNLTAGIFDVYDEKIDINDITELIFKEMVSIGSYNTSSIIGLHDALGNKIRGNQKSVYRLTEIVKNENEKVITGKMVRTFDKFTEYIKTDGKVGYRVLEESVSIYFYFDVKRELIAFCERQAFGYNQFMRAFNHFLNNNSKGYRFEIFLQKDKNVLQNKIRDLNKIRSFKATLIPPNSNEDDLIEFRKSLSYMNDCKETNANRYRVELSVDSEEASLKVESKFMQDIILAVSKGYGEVTTLGTDKKGKRRIISSNQDAAMVNEITENIDKSEFNQEAKEFIFLCIERC